MNTKPTENIAAVVLAAGLSERMGEFKPLLDINGTPALYKLLDSIFAAGITKVCVVAGHEKERIEKALAEYKNDAGLVFNKDYKTGMFSSVKAGVAWAKDSCGVLFFPADVPLVSAWTISKVCETLEGTSDKNFVLPTFKNASGQIQNGHPLYIPAAYFNEILEGKGEGGLKAIRDAHKDALVKIETDDEGSVLDMDTKEDFSALKKADAHPKIFLVRHGEPQQHSSPIFLGQADIPLSEKGKTEAAEAAGELFLRGAQPSAIYTSDLSRVKETAEIIAKKLGAKIAPDKLFREMAMGSWDGELIEEIKRKFPGEYEKRGADVLNYRVPGGENFYDLRSRVLKEFYRIWTEEFLPKFRAGEEKSLAMVAHLGVIKALVAELTGESEEEMRRRTYPTGSITAIAAPDWLLEVK